MTDTPPSNGPVSQGPVVVMRMGAANAAHHLTPLARSVRPATLTVIRPGPRPAALTEPNVHYVEIAPGPRALQVIRTAMAAWRECRRSSPPLLASFNAHPYGILATLLGVAVGVPVHVGFVGSDAERLGSRPRLLSIIDKATLVTVPGTAIQRHLAAKGLRSATHRLPHGVDETRFREASAHRDVDWIFLGHLTPGKRVHLALEAAEVMLGLGNAFQGVIVGDGPLRRDLEQLAQDLGLSALVRFVGHSDRPEQWLQRSKVIVMPSLWEGLPFALIEAMRCGVIPVATPVGAIRDLIAHEDNGMLVTDPTPVGLAQVITEALHAPGRWERMSRRAVATTANYTYHQTEQVWRLLLQLPRLQEMRSGA